MALQLSRQPLHATPPQQALYLDDPAGEQRAIFSLEWGGVLASLKYNGTELVWGHAPGGMVQPTLHNGSACFDYNPTPAGDVSFEHPGTPVLGAACNPSQVTTISGTVDFNPGNLGALSRAATVRGDHVITNLWATPYTITTYARFVANPSGSPQYYLQLDQYVTNIDTQDSIGFFLELAGYVPHSFSTLVRHPAQCYSGSGSTCTPSATAGLLGGLYPNANRTAGVAFGIAPSKYWATDPGSVTVSLRPDDINQNQSTHLENSSFTIPPGATRHFIWYVMAGNWDDAVAFFNQ